MDVLQSALDNARCSAVNSDPAGRSRQDLVAEVVDAIRGWQSAHPEATSAEIELALDERVGRGRALVRETPR